MFDTPDKQIYLTITISYSKNQVDDYIRNQMCFTSNQPFEKLSCTCLIIINYKIITLKRRNVFVIK